MAKGTAKKVALGAALAGVVGYLAGILTAPRSGKKTVDNLKKKGGPTLDNKLQHLHSQLGELITSAKEEAKNIDPKTKEEFKAALSKAKLSKERLTQVAEAFKSGGSKDKDLDKAVKEAEKALNHAKNFLLKK